jgi:outer membrane autotransporter protein
LPPAAQGYAPVHKGYDMPVAAPPAPPPLPYTVWGTGFGDFGRNGGNGNAATLDRSLGGFVIGGDGRVDGPYFNNWRIGLAGGYMSDDLRVKARASSGTFETYFGGLYAGAQYGAIDIKLGALGGGTSTDTNRTIGFPGFSDTARSSYGGTVAQGFGELGYKFGLPSGFIEPLVQGAVIHLDQDGFHESGGPAALRGYSRSYDVETTTLGLKAEAALPYGGLPLFARGFVGWRHAFGDVDPRVLMAFASGGSPFVISGAPIDRDAVYVEAGIDYRASANLVIGINYSGQAGNRADDNAVKGRVEYKF